MITYNCLKCKTLFDTNYYKNYSIKKIIDSIDILSNAIITKNDNIPSDKNIIERIKEYASLRTINDYREYECPLCGKKEVLSFYKTYERNLIFYYNSYEIICKIDIIVLECSFCKAHNIGKQHYHALLPDFILPYHIYSSYIIIDTLYLGLTKGQILKIIEERNISHQLYYSWLRGLDKYRVSASTILSVKDDILSVIINIKEDMYEFLSLFYLSYNHPFFLFKLTCVNLVIMP